MFQNDLYSAVYLSMVGTKNQMTMITPLIVL